MKELKI